MPRQSRTPYAILGCLTIEPMTGYDIKNFLSRRVVHFWQESYSQIYPALEELVDGGLIEGEEVEGERGRPKTLYRITQAGRDRLKAWLREPAAPMVPRYEHSLKLFFGANVGPAVCLEHLGRLLAEAREALAAFNAVEVELERKADAQPRSHAPYQLAVLRGGIRYFQMAENWCLEAQEQMARLPEPPS